MRGVASSCERKQIFVGQLMIVLPEGSRIGGQFAGTQRWTLLDVYVVFQEQRQIGGHYQPDHGLPVFYVIEFVRTLVVMLIKSHVSQIHDCLLFQAGRSPLDKLRVRQMFFISRVRWFDGEIQLVGCDIARFVNLL